jgi:sugar phosphate isomerase/epimerase
MPVSAVSSMFFHEYALREIFSFVQKAGLSGMEFWLETPDFWLRNRPVTEVLACRKEFAGIRNFTIHAPVLDLNPCSINPDVAAISIDHAVSAIRLADELGAGIVTVHPGRRTVKRPPSAADFERFGRYIAALREEARKHRLTVAMENMEPAVNSLLCTPQRVRELLDEEAWLSFTLDVSHALAGRPGDCGEYIRLCGDRLANVHLSRADKKRLHLPLDNSPAMADIIGSLCDAGYDGPLTLEIDDLTFDRMLTAEEKIAVLGRDAAFIASSVQRPR